MHVHILECVEHLLLYWLPLEFHITLEKLAQRSIYFPEVGIHFDRYVTKPKNREPNLCRPPQQYA